MGKKNFKIKPKNTEEDDDSDLDMDQELEMDEESEIEMEEGSEVEVDEESEAQIDEENENDNNDEDSDGSDDNIESHKQSLAKLKETDPEFFDFLQANDKKLLDFNVSDGSDDDDDDNADDDEEKAHQAPGDLEIASDESDFEDDTKESKDERVITLKMLKTWQADIQTDKTNQTITTLIRAFHAAVLRVTNAEEDEVTFYKVDGSSVFNGIIQICVLELGPALRRYLRIAPGSKQPPHKCKKFVKIKALLRGYFADLLKILTGVTSSNILTVLLKHIHYMAPMLVSYGNIIKPTLRKLTDLWGTADDSVRVVAFLCILRITSNQQQSLLDSILKMMHLTYVRNSKFVSTNSLPGINFMRRSLVEMFMLDVNVSYQHVFLYIRQLAIHLRNAITMKKKENIQAVYNWQFINSLRLWGNLLSVSYNKPQLKPLVYPFVQVSVGTLKLIPTTQYFPLRFHITQTLMDLSNNTGVFIPILPFILEVLTTYDFNKKHQKVSMKPLHFTCLLRLSKSQLTENGFKDTVIDTVYGMLLEYLSSKSNSLAFPDLSLFSIMQLKQFLKACSVASYCRKMRQIMEKIEENSKFILKERKNIQFDLRDSKQIDAWETTIKNRGTPLSKFYESWSKVRNAKKNKEATRNDIIGDYNLPVIKKNKTLEEKKRNEKGQIELFPSDSESEGDEQEAEVKPKRGKRGGKAVNAKRRKVVLEDDDDGGKFQEDIIEDIKASDW